MPAKNVLARTIYFKIDSWFENEKNNQKKIPSKVNILFPYKGKETKGVSSVIHMDAELNFENTSSSAYMASQGRAKEEPCQTPLHSR